MSCIAVNRSYFNNDVSELFPRTLFCITAAEDFNAASDSFEVIVVVLCSVYLKNVFFFKQFRSKIPLSANRKIKNVNYTYLRGLESRPTYRVILGKVETTVTTEGSLMTGPMISSSYLGF